MTARNEVFGRPAWACREPVEVQRLVVEHSLTKLQLRTLRDFAAGDVAAPRQVPHAVARALRDRGLGDITTKVASGTLQRSHPKAEFLLSAAGQELATAVTLAGLAPTRVTSPGRHPVDWDG